MSLLRLLALGLSFSVALLGTGCFFNDDVQLQPIEEPPFSYDLYCDAHGNFVGDGTDELLARRPSHLERVYADAQQGQPRARRLFQQLEASFRGAGVYVANYVTSPPCIAAPVPCKVDWTFLGQVLTAQGPGARHLRHTIADAFETQAHQRNLDNTVILPTLNLLLAGSMMKGTLAKAEAQAAIAEAQAAIAEARATVLVRVQPPAIRHYARRVKQGTMPRDLNTVIEPGVDVKADIAAINAERAEVGRMPGGEISYRVNGRTYGAHADGTLYPAEGLGFHPLNRDSFKALGVYNKFGNTPRAEQILDEMETGAADRAKALSVWKTYQ